MLRKNRVFLVKCLVLGKALGKVLISLQGCFFFKKTGPPQDLWYINTETSMRIGAFTNVGVPGDEKMWKGELENCKEGL